MFTVKLNIEVVGPNFDRVKLEKHDIPFPPENVVMVCMMVLPSDTVTEVTESSCKKYTLMLLEM